MKNIIIFFLFISLQAFAQSELNTGVLKLGDSCTMSIGGQYNFPGYQIATTNPEVKFLRQDTVSSIMLVCDTAGWKSIPSHTMYFVNPLSRAEQEHHNLNWIYGFEVFKVWLRPKGSYREGFFISYQSKDEEQTEFVGYLDDEKRPLQRNIIVWMSRRQ